MNMQFAIQNGIIYVLEVNPRASRTVPFVSKATGVPLAKVAARVMSGRTLADLGLTRERVPPYYSVKEAVFPFGKFPDADPILGPEMKSTGEVMGTGRSFGEAYAKAQAASGVVLPTRGVCLISVRERDKPGAVELARLLIARGFEIVATARHGGRARGGRHTVPSRQQGARRPSAHRRHDQERRDQPHRQHDRGQAGDPRVALDPPRGRGPQGHVLHDPRRGARRPARRSTTWTRSR